MFSLFRLGALSGSSRSFSGVHLLHLIKEQLVNPPGASSIWLDVFPTNLPQLYKSFRKIHWKYFSIPITFPPKKKGFSPLNRGHPKKKTIHLPVINFQGRCSFFGSGSNFWNLCFGGGNDTYPSACRMSWNGEILSTYLSMTYGPWMTGPWTHAIKRINWPSIDNLYFM